jgi:putative tricarboxylic transport membrane protein
VGGRSIWKGWMSVLLGLIIATIGQDPVGGINRYNFGFTDLAAGIAFVPAILGFFAVSEIFVQAEKKATGKFDAPEVGMSFPSVIELWAHKIAVVRSILVGFFCGILPGIGATLAAFMGYGEAVRWSRNKEEFGKGKLEGVISSETANNAATGAAMIPLLALGLPGGALTAMMVAVFQMHDLEPGPLVFYNSPDLIWVVFAAMFYANLSILVIGLLETKTILYLLKVPFQFLAPMILLLASIGSYIGRGLVLDVIVMFGAGILGFLLRRSGYSIPGIVLGIILGKIGEQNFAQGMQMVHYDLFTYFSRPICALLIAAGAMTLLAGIYKAVASSRNGAGN